MAHKKTLGEILIQKNLVSPDKIEKALHVQAGGRRRIGHILIKMGAISEEELFSALAEQKNIPVADLKTDVSQEAVSADAHSCYCFSSAVCVTGLFYPQKYSFEPLRHRIRGRGTQGVFQS